MVTVDIIEELEECYFLKIHHKLLANSWQKWWTCQYFQVFTLKAVLTFIDSKEHKFDSNWWVEKHLLIANGINLALINEWRNVSQQ